MKKAVMILFTLILIAAAGIGVSAADCSVTSTVLPLGNAFEPYDGQITVSGGDNTGYSFTLVSGSLPAGLTLAEDTGRITGPPKASGSFKGIRIRVSHTDGSSAIHSFSIIILPRKMEVVVSAPPVPYDGQPHKATVTCYDTDGNELTDVEPDVRYGSELLQAAEDVGTYYIRISPPSGYSISKRTGDSYLTIIGLPVESLTVQNKTITYGDSVGITDAEVTVVPAEAGWKAEYLVDGVYTEVLPTAMGSYPVRVRTTNPYYETAYATATLTIKGRPVDFIVSNATATYDGNPHYAEVKPTSDQITEDMYTWSYLDRYGNTVTDPTYAGTYTIVVTLLNAVGYEVGTISPASLIISGTEVTFTVSPTSIPYTGQSVEPQVTTTPTIDSSKYAVTYLPSAGGEAVSSVKDADTYTVLITMKDGAFSISDSSTKTVTVTPISVTFTVTEGTNTATYDGNGHEVGLTVEPQDIDKSLYSVAYKRRGSSETADSAVAAGVYDISISFNNRNYVVAPGFSGSMTVYAGLTVNPGNSPAAMVEKATNLDSDQKTTALAELTSASRSFSTAVPEGAVAGISYPSLASLTGVDLDAAAQTLIVTDVENLPDPGLTVADGLTGTGYSAALTEVEDVPGLYQLTYTYTSTGQKASRYVLVLDGRFGDVNGDGHVNNIDANALSGASVAPATVAQARLWDVTKDGQLSGDDAAAIRGRYTAPLQVYYPWID